MILIADSGSTKTDWRLVDDQKRISQFSTQGLNPYFLSAEAISKEIRDVLIPSMKDMAVNEIFFYGSGCGAEEKKLQVGKALRENFPGAKIEIQTDISGTARGLCGSRPGIAAILGTGSNACYYNGEQITEQSPSLGYLLGDEGSGSHLGKTFISALLYHELPAELEGRFYERFKTGRTEILENIYAKPFPNRYLASFSKFIHQNLKEQAMVDLTANCFRQFFDKQVIPLRKHNEVFHCSGSVGFYFSNILRRVAEEKNIPVGTIVETPIAAICNYHLGE